MLLFEILEAGARKGAGESPKLGKWGCLASRVLHIFPVAER